MTGKTYIWRTVGDSRTRSEHADREGKIFRWTNPPEDGHPGEPFGCRCWAEVAEKKQGHTNSLPKGLKQEIITVINAASKQWEKIDFSRHFYFGNGQGVSLSQIGLLGAVVEVAQKIIFDRVKNQVANKAKDTGSGKLNDTFERSYNFQEAAFSLRNATVRGRFQGDVKKEGDLLTIDVVVDYLFDEEFTDPANIREEVFGTSSFQQATDLQLLFTEFGGEAYKITDSWRTKITGSIKSTS